MSDYYNGFDANARAEENKPGVEHSTVTRVMIKWPQHGRHGWVGDISHYEETMMGPLVCVVFANGERGLYQHEYLRAVGGGR